MKQLQDSNDTNPSPVDWAHELYLALQGITSCPGKCKCCKEHSEKALQVLSAFINRWRE